MEREFHLADPQARLAARLHRHLLACGLDPGALPQTPQVRATAPMVATLIGERALADQLSWALYALVVNVVDGLLDCPQPAPADLDAVAALAVQGEASTGHLLHAVVRAAREGHPPGLAMREVGRWIQAFCAAQLRQRAQAGSYLEYLENRIVAQGVPLLIRTAAALVEPAALRDPGLARRITLTGTVTGLVNDLATYDQEVAEGVASSANARGVLAAVTGLSPRRRALTRLIRADIAGARRALAHELNPHSSLDQLIARIVALVEQTSKHRTLEGP